MRNLESGQRRVMQKWQIFLNLYYKDQAMAFTSEEKQKIKTKIQAFLDRKRPEENIRHKIDLGCDIKGQSVLIYEIRSHPVHPEEKIYPAIAKATFNKSRKVWKIYWQRANMKWEVYPPRPMVDDLDLFFKEVEEDRAGCFYG